LTGGTSGTTELRRGAELLALTGLAITQPVLDVLGNSPETFVFRGVDGAQLVVFALLVALLPGLALWALGAATRVFGPSVRAGVHLATVAALVGVAVLVAVRLADLAKGPTALLIAVAAAVAGGVLYTRVAGARSFLLYLSPLPLVAAALFLFSSPVSGLVDGGDTEVVEDVGSDQPVVMLVLDEFPTATLLDDRGQVDATQFPNFARLAERSTWFRNYTTHNAGTVQAVPSLLSGQLPTRGRAPLVTDWPTNLFTLLGGSYDMAVQETVTQLCPPNVCGNDSRTVTQRTPVDGEGLEGAVGDATDVLRQLVSLNAEPEVEIDEFTEETVSVPAPEEMGAEDRNQVTNQPTRFTDFLDGMVRDEDPTLHFVHLILPHGPWRFYPDGTEYVSPDGDPEGEIAGTWADAWPAEMTRFRLELQAQYTDALVGRTIDRMQESGLWDDALFVVVADHGGAFVVGEPGRALGEDNAFEVMWTPLFIRDPDLAHGIDETDVEATDLLPTMADLLDVDLPYEVDGASAVSAPDTSGTKRYQRLQNAFQVEPDALLDIDTASNYARLLDDHWPIVEVDAPVAGFYRRYPLGGLYGQAVADLTVGEPAGTATLDQRDGLEGGGDGALPAYLGGEIDVDGAGDDTWVVVAVNGVVQGFSQLFPMVDTESAYSILLSQEAASGAGHQVDLYVTDGPDQPLRPLALP
jgi:Sulfatase